MKPQKGNFQHLALSDNGDTMIDKLVDNCEEARPIIVELLREYGVNDLVRLDFTKRTGKKLVELHELCGSISQLHKILFGVES